MQREREYRLTEAKTLQIIKCPKCKHAFPTRRQGKFQCGKCGKKWNTKEADGQ